MDVAASGEPAQRRHHQRGASFGTVRVGGGGGAQDRRGADVRRGRQLRGAGRQGARAGCTRCAPDHEGQTLARLIHCFLVF